MVDGAIGSPYVPSSHSFGQNDVAIIRCEDSPGEDTVATGKSAGYPWRTHDRIVARAGEEPRGGWQRRRPDAGQPRPRRAVLLLHRRADVADPRRLHVVRDRHRTEEERARHGDEEHPHDRRRDADVLLLRLVGLQLQPARPPDRPEL